MQVCDLAATVLVQMQRLMAGFQDLVLQDVLNVQSWV